MTRRELIQRQEFGPYQSVSAWCEPGKGAGPQRYRKVWQSAPGHKADAWLSWAHHEHLMLTLLAGHGAEHVVLISGLQVNPGQVELVTLDAGPELQRDWLARSYAPLFAGEAQALKLARSCVRALVSIHRLGVVHGDVKTDNLRVQPSANPRGLDLSRLRRTIRAVETGLDHAPGNAAVHALAGRCGSYGPANVAADTLARLAPAGDASPATQRPAQSRLGSPRWQGVLASAILAALFALIDRHFVGAGLRLDDLGYALGLSAFALAVPLLLSAGWQAMRPTPRYAFWLRLLALALLLIAAYFTSRIWAQRSDPQLVVILVLSLFALAWVLRRET